MKALKKLKVIAVILAVTLTMCVCSLSAFGLEEILGGLAGSGDLSALDDVLGGFNLENFDINEILGSFSSSDYSGILGSIIASLGEDYAGFTDNEIFVAIGKVVNDIIANGGDVSKIDIDSQDFISMIAKYLNPSAEVTTGGEEESTTAVQEQTTVQPTTQEPETTTEAPEAVTRPPATAAPYTAAPVYQESPVYVVTQAPETTTQPSYEVVTQAIVTMPELTSQYNVTDENIDSNGKTGITKQMIIGIVILVLSAVAVVVVAIFLKKSRE